MRAQRRLARACVLAVVRGRAERLWLARCVPLARATSMMVTVSMLRLWPPCTPARCTRRGPLHLHTTRHPP